MSKKENPSKNAAPITYRPGNLGEIAAIHAKYGRAISEFDFYSPEYERSAIEDFCLKPSSDRDLAQTLNMLNQWGVLDRVNLEDESYQNQEVYVMRDDNAKGDSLIVWRTVLEELNGRADRLISDFNQVEDNLRDRGFTFLNYD